MDSHNFLDGGDQENEKDYHGFGGRFDIIESVNPDYFTRISDKSFQWVVSLLNLSQVKNGCDVRKKKNNDVISA